ncbi:NACHT domain-containing protein [Nocardia sp. N2S4-5]|uniref:NACHT domain-containing protein n=1 Tax=Nocardia sp. N2S4-5 TaxID=3351565 RepID=UPI0037D59EBC
MQIRNSSTEECSERIPIRRAVEQYRNLLLLGTPGIGKSWSIQMHAIRMAEKAVGQLDSGIDLDAIDLPVLMRCDALASRMPARPGSSPLTAQDLTTAALGVLAEHDPDMRAEMRTFLERRLNDGHGIVFLLDALDETNPAARETLTVLLREYAAASPAHIVVTARTTASHVFDRHSPFQAEATALGFANPEPYVHTWQLPPERERQVITLIYRTVFRDLAKIPLMLALLCNLAADNTDELPTSVTVLFSRTLRQFLRGDNRRRADPDASSLPVDPIEREAFLMDVPAPLAFRLATDPNGWVDRIPSSVLRRHLSALTQTTGVTASRAATMLTSDTGILVRDGDIRDGRDSMYLFLHRTMMEYLVAEYLATHTELIDPTARVHLHLSDDWSEVWTHTAGIDSAIDPLMGVLTAMVTSGNDPLHAALALAASVINDMDVAQHERNRDHIEALIDYVGCNCADTPAYEVVSELFVILAGLQANPHRSNEERNFYWNQLGPPGRRPPGPGELDRRTVEDYIDQLILFLESAETTDRDWLAAAERLMAATPPRQRYKHTAVVAALLQLPECDDFWDRPRWYGSDGREVIRPNDGEYFWSDQFQMACGPGTNPGLGLSRIASFAHGATPFHALVPR